MSITLFAVPKFTLELDLATLNDLIILANTHYDATCRAAAKEGGLLRVWEQGLKIEAQPQGSFRDLDLTLKLCEMAVPVFHRDREARERVWRYALMVRRALETANNLSADQWPTVVVQ